MIGSCLCCFKIGNGDLDCGHIMNLPGWYFVSVSIHILAAIFWLGGMLFLVFVLLPALKTLDDAVLRSQLIRKVGLRFRSVGWACLITLLITGYGNLLTRGLGGSALLDAAFWGTTYGITLGIKLSVFLLILILSATHDFSIGPRAGMAARERPNQPETIRLRRMATWFGRFNLVLVFVMVIAGISLSRGWPW